MQSSHLNKLLNILKLLHACFILTILTTGTVGSIIFGLIVVEPIRNCPVIHIIFITFWLTFAIGLFQLVVALIFLIWFLFTFFCTQTNKQSHSMEKPSISTFPTVAQAVGHPFGHCWGYKTNAIDVPINFNQFSSTQHSYSISLETLDTDFNESSSYCCCRPKVGWLCLGSIILIILSAGLVLNIILVENCLWRVHHTLKSEMESVFVEAKQAWNNSYVSQANMNDRSLVCWNIIQSSYECCGVGSSLDWGTTAPQSCSPSGSSQTYVNGCANPLQNSIKMFLESARAYVIATLIFLAVTFLTDFIYTLYTAHVTLAQNQSIDHSNIHPLSQVQSTLTNCSGLPDINVGDEFRPSSQTRSRPISDLQTNRM